MLDRHTGVGNFSDLIAVEAIPTLLSVISARSAVTIVSLTSDGQLEHSRTASNQHGTRRPFVAKTYIDDMERLLSVSKVKAMSQ